MLSSQKLQIFSCTHTNTLRYVRVYILIQWLYYIKVCFIYLDNIHLKRIASLGSKLCFVVSLQFQLLNSPPSSPLPQSRPLHSFSCYPLLCLQSCQCIAPLFFSTLRFLAWSRYRINYCTIEKRNKEVGRYDYTDLFLQELDACPHKSNTEKIILVQRLRCQRKRKIWNNAKRRSDADRRPTSDLCWHGSARRG